MQFDPKRLRTFTSPTRPNMYGAVADGQFQVATDGVRLIRMPCGEVRNVRFEKGGGMVEGGLDATYYPNVNAVYAVFPREFNQVAWYSATVLREVAKKALALNKIKLDELWAVEKVKPSGQRKTLAKLKDLNPPRVLFRPDGTVDGAEPLVGTLSAGRVQDVVAINAQFLLDAIVGAKSEVIIRLVDAYSPVQLEHGVETHLIMPIRL
jgi:hypothetical protein